jgi:hypothetical protein
MRSMILALALAAFGAPELDHAHFAVPTAIAAKVQVVRGTPTVIVTWTDTAATIVRSEVRRRSNGSDTVWTKRGYTQGGTGRFEDEPVTLGKLYRYQVRDSIAGQGFSAWSDSASVTLSSRQY